MTAAARRRTAFERLMFESDGMKAQEIARLLRQLVVQKQRWIGGFHPSSAVRRAAFKASGVKVGKDVFISIGMVVLDGYQKIVSIGDRVAFGNYVSLVAASAPNDSVLSRDPALRTGAIKTAPIAIGKDAWIGTGAIVLPGVTIGARAVVGAGAVVRENVPPGAFVAGVPARLIRGG